MDVRTFFFNLPATSEIYTLSLHDALPIYKEYTVSEIWLDPESWDFATELQRRRHVRYRSEEHTSELQSHVKIVCRVQLEKKKVKLRAPTIAYGRRSAPFPSGVNGRTTNIC